MADTTIIVPLATSGLLIDSFVLFDGLTIPTDSILYQDGGQATTGSSTTCQDTTKTWVVNEFDGWLFRNTSDNSSALISSNTSNTLTFATLTGGNNNTVSADHYYEIVTPIDASDEIHWSSISSLGGLVSMTVKGVPSITGANGDHIIAYNFVDVSVPDTSADYQVTITL